ncbi:leucine-rich melanocyte differentiation-associated protein-like [Melitaea cinxia]|uniref:leucine-rich melanocyte differentiation-associated protein-like n=1 Tax=Melitaea cinxia TaxID=113334 RepID=UPI001E2726E7|nr:leucine-rich melanocyte differentiation-associated protein-like [Melitaea cinxia]
MAQNQLPAAFIQSTEDLNDHDETTKLTLAYERLYELPTTIIERFCDHVQYLDISHNKITNLDGLVHFKLLTTLIADDNPITENCSFPPMPKLQLLWLNRCKIASLYPWVSKLKESCPNLQYLSLMGNPAAPSYFNGGTFYEYLQYRLFVISQFPSLLHLDDRKVTDDQREESQRLYKRPFLERIVKPGSKGMQLINGSLNWNSMHNKLSLFWNKEKVQRRNLLI